MIIRITWEIKLTTGGISLEEDKREDNVKM